MKKNQIWEVLETCLLATDGADEKYFDGQGFNPQLAKVGLELYLYLKSKEIDEDYEK